MSIKSNIRKILLLAAGLVLGAGLMVLLVAAINKKNHRACTGMVINIKAGNGPLFLDKREIQHILAAGPADQPTGKPLAGFDLKKMEADLEQNVWIRDAQLFFDNNAVLRVVIDERWPVARIFTVNGNSFYIDSTGKRLPLSSRVNMKLPVFSNFPADGEKLVGADSALMTQIKTISPFILADPFWNAQIGQIDITSNRTFEMIPVVGRHVILFGDGNDYAEKFHRLLLFYQQVAARAGMDKYSSINVQYSNQVVATRKGTSSRIDSLQALKNIQKLIEASHQLPDDTVSTMVDNNIVASAAPVPTLTILKDRRSNATQNDSLASVSNIHHPAPAKRQPKALMKRPSGLQRPATINRNN